MVNLIPIMLVLLGLVLLSKGADFLVDGSTIIARKFKIPEIVIGLTIIAIRNFIARISYKCYCCH